MKGGAAKSAARRQRLVRVDGKERARLKAQLRMTRIDWQRWQAGQAARHGPAACRSCGAQPCGHSWRVSTRWGDAGGYVEPDESRFCCERCTHRSPPGWRASHVVWGDAYGEPVMELEMRAGDRLYMRADGVVQWMALASDVDGDVGGGAGEEGAPAPRAPLLLGRAEPMAVLLARGSSDSETPGGEWGGPRVVGTLASRQSARTGGAAGESTRVGKASLSSSSLAVALPEPATREVGESLPVGKASLPSRRMLDGQVEAHAPAVSRVGKASLPSEQANDRRRKHG